MSLKAAWNAILDLVMRRSRSSAEPARSTSGAPIDAVRPLPPVDKSPPVPATPAVATNAARQPGVIDIAGDIEGNIIELGDNITLTGTLRGRGNVIRIGAAPSPRRVDLRLYGNDNTVQVGERSLLQSLRVEIGSPRWRCSQSRLNIGKNFSIASNGRFIMPNSGNVIEIGDDCMFSSNILIRGGEYPHLIFDRDSGEYLDVSSGIFIGNHVWVGEGVFIGKAVTLPDDTIVGTRSVVTKRFDDTHCVIAGNPARIVKRSVQWLANEYVLEKQFPAGHAMFEQTGVNRINRAVSEGKSGG